MGHGGYVYSVLNQVLNPSCDIVRCPAQIDPANSCYMTFRVAVGKGRGHLGSAKVVSGFA